MVFYNVYNYIASFWGGGLSELEDQKLRSAPILVVELSAEQLQEKIKTLRKVDTDIARKIREDIEFNSIRIDHIRTKEEIENNKPLSELEMNKIRNASIKVFDCVSADLRVQISKLKNVTCDSITSSIELEEEEVTNPTILDEIKIIQDVGISGWFESRKK